MRSFWLFGLATPNDMELNETVKKINSAIAFLCKLTFNEVPRTVNAVTMAYDVPNSCNKAHLFVWRSLRTFDENYYT